MDLQELLDSVGLNKSQLAKLLGVSRSTVMRMGDEVCEEVLEVVDKYKLTDSASITIPVPEMVEKSVVVGKRLLEPEEYTPKAIKLLCVRRVDESDYDVACSIGISVFEFRGMIDRLVKYCTDHKCTSASLL